MCGKGKKVRLREGEKLGRRGRGPRGERTESKEVGTETEEARGSQLDSGAESPREPQTPILPLLGPESAPYSETVARDPDT